MGTSGTVESHGAIGKTIAGKYRIVRRIGEGGMGAVYEAEHTVIGKRVAIKVLHPEYAVKEDVVRRFQQEAKSAATIGHPNIIAILDLDHDADGSLYMVQELLSGVDLAVYLQEQESGRLPSSLAVRICLPVLSALCAAHARGILHRDLKPANIFLSVGPTPGTPGATPGAVIPKVIDFGIAKVMSGTGAGQTRQGGMMGTLAYMSPEQLYGDPTLDGQTDVWAMGAVLYELLAGQCPFPPPADMNLAAVALFAERVRSQPAPRIEALVPNIAPDLAAIIHQALATEREARFRTMQELHDVLAGCSVARNDHAFAVKTDPGAVHGLTLGGPAHPVAVPADSPSVVAATAATAAPATVIAEIRSRPRPVYLVLGLVVGAALLLLGATFVVLRGSASPAPVRAEQPVGEPSSPPDAVASAPAAGDVPATATPDAGATTATDHQPVAIPLGKTSKPKKLRKSVPSTQNAEDEGFQ